MVFQTSFIRETARKRYVRQSLFASAGTQLLVTLYVMGKRMFRRKNKRVYKEAFERTLFLSLVSQVHNLL
jgi:hypothetical protein